MPPKLRQVLFTLNTTEEFQEKISADNAKLICKQHTKAINLYFLCVNQASICTNPGAAVADQWSKTTVLSTRSSMRITSRWNSSVHQRTSSPRRCSAASSLDRSPASLALSCSTMVRRRTRLMVLTAPKWRLLSQSTSPPLMTDKNFWHSRSSRQSLSAAWFVVL